MSLFSSSRFAPEPPQRHGQPERTAILLCNLGTPDAPTAAALRRYLAQFLSDPRVVELPRIAWLPLLYGVILPTRPAKSAAKYASIWTQNGSPLLVWSAKQALLLQGWMGQVGHNVLVRHAMRYGQPSIANELTALRAQGATRILILPLYPQYASATSASVFDAVYTWAAGQRYVPELRFVNSYHDHSGYIAALARSVLAHWKNQGRPEMLVMSFHGVPERTLHLGDPYHCHSQKTARLLAQALGLQDGQWCVTFQSRFGKAKWLEPATEPTLIDLARRGVRRVDVICPGFTSDCLETLEEINQEVRAAFLAAGGQEFGYIACLNDRTEWIGALRDIAVHHLAGWPTSPHPRAEDGARTRERALAQGACA